jgi:hypothetical protein
MDPDDDIYFRVIFGPTQGHTVLDAHCVGDILLHFHRSNFHGNIRTSSELPNQVALLYSLIEHFGPNQVVGVPAFGDPLENFSFERAFFFRDAPLVFVLALHPLLHPHS